ncbi:MAG: GNAT family N-acetyltransferase [Clostridia bacterium]|nr:GNAT family N-acetyltransferase [Clostridia bacterium]
MQLVKVNMDEFKIDIYPEYLKLFPEDEQKPYLLIEKSVNNNIMNIFKIVVDNRMVGFIITNTLKENGCVQLDYFAILPEYQSKGYGSKAMELLKEESKEYYGIFIEIEKPGLASSEEENKIRQKRAKFYERLGFIKLKFGLNLFNVIYSTYLLPCSKENILEEKVIEDIFEIYNAISGEKRIKENCKLILG